MIDMQYKRGESMINDNIKRFLLFSMLMCLVVMSARAVAAQGVYTTAPPGPYVSSQDFYPLRQAAMEQLYASVQAQRQQQAYFAAMRALEPSWQTDENAVPPPPIAKDIANSSLPGSREKNLETIVKNASQATGYDDKFNLDSERTSEMEGDKQIVQGRGAIEFDSALMPD
jgi:hypothetical protein